MGLHKTETFLHSKGLNNQSGETAYKMKKMLANYSSVGDLIPNI
jgi:hypothetical protein